MMQLDQPYDRETFLQFLENHFIPNFKKDLRPINTQGLPSIQKAYSLGRCKELDLQVFEFQFIGSSNKRIALTKEAFQVMRSSAIFKALAIFYSNETRDWRFSLMTATPERTDRGKVKLSYSNPKRLSFFLGPNAKTNTPTKFILKKDRIMDFDDLKSRFSIEVVNKEFYEEISRLFIQLVGGVLNKGKVKEDLKSLLKLPSMEDKSKACLEFAVRLIGRVIFCWFLREKKSNQGKSLMPNTLLSSNTVNQVPDYYHKILEPIFFEVLNKPMIMRKEEYNKEPFLSIPYLNGGLFSPHEDDFYKCLNNDYQSQFHNTLIVPDEWLKSLFAVLETYNFTIDENTSFDEELSIDPEMLGRIFENLLAEINPETGESARKNTGSYYTPRTIVDYMVDESIYFYLKNLTQIGENKLRAVISYDLNDDEENQTTDNEKQHIIDALEKVKILDPACGSGAFPIGALQKIVFILQQTDPEGQLWFKKQIKNTSPEIRRVVEREFAHKNFDYIRKLGIIRENIYGVDIQPIATEISRLRCFLTLVVDERIQEDLENRGIEPLPNLDFKFVTANTLVSLPESQKVNQLGLFEDDKGIKELKELRDMFFNAIGIERDQLKLQFVQAQNRMFQRLIGDGRRGHADLTTKLSTWDPFSHKSASWFDPEWMFGIKEGFDIVIANPPYIYSRNKKFTETEQVYFRNKSNLITHRLNTFILFIENGFSLLKEGGVLSFITPNNWLTVDSFFALRNFILDKTGNIKIINTYGSVFEDASVDTCILILSKTNNHHITLGEFISHNDVVYYGTYTPSFFDIVNRTININLTKNKEFIEHLTTINGNSQKLSDLALIKHGVVAYLVGDGIPKQTKQIRDTRAYHSRIREDDSYLKYLEGKDIGRYRISWSGEYIKYGKNLARRSQLEYFQNPRILIKQIPSSPPHCINAVFVEEEYVNDINSEIIMTSKEKLLYLLAILNSKPFSYWFQLYFDKFQRKIFPQVKLKEMALFAIPKSDNKSLLYLGNVAYSLQKLYQKLLISEKESDLSKLTSEISALENNIDNEVYKLYGISLQTIEAIKSNVNNENSKDIIIN